MNKYLLFILIWILLYFIFWFLYDNIIKPLYYIYKCNIKLPNKIYHILKTENINAKKTIKKLIKFITKANIYLICDKGEFSKYTFYSNIKMKKFEDMNLEIVKMCLNYFNMYCGFVLINFKANEILNKDIKKIINDYYDCLDSNIFGNSITIDCTKSYFYLRGNPKIKLSFSTVQNVMEDKQLEISKIFNDETFNNILNIYSSFSIDDYKKYIINMNKELIYINSSKIFIGKIDILIDNICLLPSFLYKKDDENIIECNLYDKINKKLYSIDDNASIGIQTYAVFIIVLNLYFLQQLTETELNEVMSILKSGE